MKVEVVLTETDIAQEFVEAIEARDLPEKFFFWFPNSAQAWSRLSGDTSVYGGLDETWRAIAAKAAAFTREFPASVPVISFGAGDGQRDRLLLGAIKQSGRDCRYFPVDASQPMLELACGAGDDEDVETTGIKADISSPVHLVYAADAAEPPRVFIMAGNTMGAFDPLAEIRYLAQSMSPADRLIVDGEMFSEERTLAVRSTPAVRGFVAALLGAIGINAADGEMRFNHKRDERHAGLNLVTRHFRAEQDITASAAGQKIELQRGERIGLNFNYVYTPEAFRWLIGEHGGLTILDEWASPDGRFLTLLCRK
jgi:uncharacterized SAM-dependent methyltransferase